MPTTSGNEPAPTPSSFHAAVAEFKANLIRDTVEKAGGNLSEAARQLGLHRNYVTRIMRDRGSTHPEPHGS